MIKYTPTHEWIDITESEVTVGITDYAANELGEIVFIELPEVGSEVTAGIEVVVIESVTTTSEILSPVSGVVTVVNEELIDNPALVNEAAEDTWFFRVAPSDPSEAEAYLDEVAYAAHIGA